MKSLLFIILGTASAANPIGQVLVLLQNLYNVVVQDGEVEQKEFEEFAKWCKTQATERQFEIKTGKAQAANFRATIEKSVADIEVATSKIAELSSSISTLERDLKEATKIRDSEHATYVKEENELMATVDTLRRAQQVLKKSVQGGGGSFLQKDAAFAQLSSSLETIIQSAVLSTHNRDELQAFLQQGEDGVNAPATKAYESKSSGIVDTLADMQDKAENLLAEARKTETNAAHSYKMLSMSFQNEIKASNKALTNTKKQLSATSEVKAGAEGDLSSTLKDLNEDEVYVKDLSLNCQTRAVDAETSQKGRAEELKALSDARHIIEEATGGASERQYSFLQVEETTAYGEDEVSFYQKVEKAIKSLGRKDGNTMLTQLAGKIRATVSMNANPFAKVKTMIQDMVQKLVEEAEQEATQKAFCDKETSENEAKRGKLEEDVSKLSTRVEKAVSGVATLREHIADLNKALLETAQSQKELDALRKEEREQFGKTKGDFEKGLQGVRSALKVLREYYQKSDDAGAFLQTSSGNAAGGIIGILEVAESDFAKSLADTTTEEDDAVEVYKQTTQDNKVSNSTKKASVEGKTQETARLEQIISDATGDRNGVQEELSAVNEYLAKLHSQCVTEPESYEDRVARREQEIEGLKNALDVLQNETAFVQQRVRSHREQM